MTPCNLVAVYQRLGKRGRAGGASGSSGWTAQKMEGTDFSEKDVTIYQTKRRHITKYASCNMREILFVFSECHRELSFLN